MGACASIPEPKPEGNFKIKKDQVKPDSPNAKSKFKKDACLPLVKTTVFGYPTNFNQRYRKGKLLGHGQFGYTYEAIEISSGERFAVKMIDKKKVSFVLLSLN
jgi:calcium-dependent protein kinase